MRGRLRRIRLDMALRVIVVTALFVLAGTMGAPGAPAASEADAITFSSDNVEYVNTVLLGAPATSSTLHDGFLYVSTSRGLLIYDAADAEAPVLVGELPVAHHPLLPQENLITNGKIVLWQIGQSTMVRPGLQVVDVRDKSEPTIIAQLPIYTSAWTCVLRCSYAYASSGTILDLRDEMNPAEVGDWQTTEAHRGAHAITEVSPGVVLAGSTPPTLLDARKDPAQPRVLAGAWGDEQMSVHGVHWPGGMQGDSVLMAGATDGLCTTSRTTSFATYDGKRFKGSGILKLRDRLIMEVGPPNEGGGTITTDCPHWFELHPRYRKGGHVAVPWYERGTRFVEITPGGDVRDAGYFIPVGGSAWSTHWASDRVVYSIDLTRGIDILRFKP